MHKTQRAGFTILEILIALVALSIGFLSVLALQLSTVRAVQDAHFESVALQRASDIAEQYSNAGATQFSTSTAPQFAVGGPANGMDAISCYGIEAQCSATQATAFAARESLALLRSEIPGARVEWCHDSAPWRQADHAWRWGCGGSYADPLWIKIGWTSRRKPSVMTDTPQFSIMLGVLAS